MPGRNGGTLLVGGTQGGRKPSYIREGLRLNLLATEQRLREQCRAMEAVIESRKETLGVAYANSPACMTDLDTLNKAESRYAEFCAKYGLGTTTTATDTEGNDAGTTAPGRLTADERKARITALLAETRN